MASKRVKKAMETVPSGVDDRRRVRDLERQLEATEKRLHELRVSKFRLPEGKPGQRKASGTFLRLVIPDTHGSVIDAGACRAFLSDLDSLQPAEVVLLGDHLDAGGWLAEHHVFGYVPDHQYSVAEDEDAANQFLDAVQQRCKGAAFHYLEGNHEWRIERTIAGAKKMNQADAKRFMERNGPEAVMHLIQRGIPYYRRSEKYYGLQSRGVIKLGKCMFTHGQDAPKHAADRYAALYGGNIVFAHTHRPDFAIASNVESGVYGAWNFGCLCELSARYQHTRPSKWSHGYGLQVVEKSGEFLTIHIPIIGGVSLLRLLAAKLGA